MNARLGSLALLLLSPALAAAQPAASEAATVSQTVDGTKITVAYSRPVARGRTGLFGRTVKFGHTWTPGANMATTLAVTKDVTIERVAVPKGKYSVWMVVAEGPWELVLDRDTTLFHTQPPRRRAGQVRIPLAREKRPFLEVLTWSFPEVRTTGTTLVMQWDTVAVPMHVDVTPSYSRAVAGEAGARVAGRYHVKWEPMPEMPKDSTIDTSEDEKPATEMTFTVRHEGGELRATMDPPMYSTEPGYRDWVLIPKKGDWYYPARLLDGQLVEVIDFAGFRFDVVNGKAKGFEVRAPNDMLLGRGTRLPDSASRP